MRKKLNLIALVSQAISVLLLFMPGVFREEQWMPVQYGGHMLNSDYSKYSHTRGMSRLSKAKGSGFAAAFRLNKYIWGSKCFRGGITTIKM